LEARKIWTCNRGDSAPAIGDQGDDDSHRGRRSHVRRTRGL